MMNSETKRHIDSARQVLVGVVPNPTSQIDQITNALIYKFMDDMDQAAIKAGGQPSFFVEELAQYAWTRIMDRRIGSQERMNLYQEALLKFSQSKRLPELFRDVFKTAFLPYRSPEVLDLFLKQIDYFDYSHPEELGNAYEYLLSIMSSQGDAGQFRTPRNIIDFVVDIVNPTKDDKILDPACGTAGFLISAYNHILDKHNPKLNPDNKELSKDDKINLVKNFEGYDIDPMMVRIAQVNMYLHQFKRPQIHQHDSLSNDEKWSDKFDVILANPPFMSPKGGVKTHNRFTIDSTRSEVLFVDYIMNHLRPKGKAGIIVPEGIIFKSDKAYKQLRKNMLEDGLYAVISLPSGIFNPYSGVKTSILLLDKELAKQKEEILFIKVENDGFDLGAQRRPISKNDLPIALEIVNKWNQGEKLDHKLALYVEKSKIAETDDYNLSGDRYRINTDYTNTKWPMVELGEVAEILNGYSFKSQKYTNNGIRIIRITNVQKGEIIDNDPKFYPQSSIKEISKFLLDENDLLISLTGNVGRIGLLKSKLLPAGLNQRVGCIRLKNKKQISINYLFRVLNTDLFEKDCISSSSGVAQKNLSTEWLKKYKIPLPPLEVQEQIVAELDGYSAIINGAKQITQNWKPKIDIDPEWEKVKLGEIGKIRMCKRIFKEQTSPEGDIPFYKIGTFGKTPDAFIKQEVFNDFKEKFSYPQKGEVLISTSGTIGRTVVFDGKPAYFQDSNIVWIENDQKKVYNNYLNLVFQDIDWITTKGGTIERLYNKLIEEKVISIPSLSIQKQIVEKIEAERALVESTKKLIDIYEQKTKTTIAKLWEE